MGALSWARGVEYLWIWLVVRTRRLWLATTEVSSTLQHGNSCENDAENQNQIEIEQEEDRSTRNTKGSDSNEMPSNEQVHSL